MASINSAHHFALVVCADGTSSEVLLRSLAKNNASALNVLNYEHWLERKHNDQVDLLWIKRDGSHIYARDKDKKDEIARRITACVALSR